jgi:hypothetical protein
MARGVELLTAWLAFDHYDRKKQRLAGLQTMDVGRLVNSITVTVAQVQAATLFTNVVGQVAGYLNLSDKVDAIKTVSEMLAVLESVEIFDLFKPPGSNSLHIQCAFEMGEELASFIKRTKYLPPMVVAPVEIKKNTDCGYLTLKDTLVLGAHNQHSMNLRLDVINKFNQTPLSLDVDMLMLYNEIPKKAFKDSINKKGERVSAQEKEVAFEKMRVDSMQVYHDLIKAGNKMYLTHKPCKRGRLHAQGYHVTTQGTSFKKAIVNLHTKEIIGGAPAGRKKT